MQTPCLQSVRLKMYRHPIDMNANELADYLDNNVEAMLFTEQPYLDQAATMLRQQQAELDALQERNRFLESFYRTVKAQSK